MDTIYEGVMHLLKNGRQPPDQNAPPSGAALARRQELMRICAAATRSELATALRALEPLPAVRDLRQPEVGLVMARGRIGGTGAAFNIGEVPVTRAAVTLDGGGTGHAYVLGRCTAKARLAAIVDALGQDERFDERLEAHLLAPVRQRRDRELTEQRAQTAATRVDFFTLVRGEDT